MSWDASVFIPLTFVVGVYGMNFENMPELGWRWGYPGVLLFMAVVTAGMLGYFRRKHRVAGVASGAEVLRL